MRLSTLRGTLQNRTFTLFTGKSTTKNKRTKKGGLRTGIGYSTLIQLGEFAQRAQSSAFERSHISVGTTRRLSCGTSRDFVSNGTIFFFLNVFIFYTLGMRRCCLLYLSRVIKSSNSITRPRRLQRGKV